MDSHRKLQLGSAAAIVNAVLVLASSAPKVALANPCAPSYTVPGACPPSSYCQTIAPPGCTATSMTCVPSQPVVVVCRYD